MSQQKVIGKVSATEKCPSTIDEFYFWTDKKQILSPFDVVKVYHEGKMEGERSITYGVIESINHVTDAPSHFSSYISSDFGDTSDGIGNMNRLGMNYVKDFVQPNGEIKKFGNINWYTNIPHNKRNTELDLYRKYDAVAYPKYDNYDAIEVSKVSEIPMDYEGVMGVPITFLDKYCPSQFEILDARNHTSVEKLKNKSTFLVKDKDSAINGKPTYARILIKRRL